MYRLPTSTSQTKPPVIGVGVAAPCAWNRNRYAIAAPGFAGSVFGTEAAQAEAVEEPEIRSAVAAVRRDGQARAGVEVAGDAEVADVREPGVIEDRRADEDAEAAAAQHADPVTELQAEALELELLDERAVCPRVTGADGGAQALQLGRLLRELTDRAAELEGFADRVLDRRQRELPAEREAREHAAHAAEPLADQIAELKQLRSAQDRAELRGVAGVRRRDRRVEDVALGEQQAQRAAGRLQLADEIGPPRAIGNAQPVADQAIADDADPVAEQVAVRHRACAR